MSKLKYKPVSHVIFTVDGLMVATPPTTVSIFNEICEKYNKGPLNLDLQHKLLGRSEKDQINMVINELSLPIRFPVMQEMFQDLEMKKHGKAKLFPGIERLTCHFVKNKIPIAIATSSRVETLDTKFSLYRGIYENFRLIVTASDPDIENSKPDPKIFKLCAERFDPPALPECCLVLEDSPAGVSAACCAGMQVVMVPDPMLDPGLIKDATVVLKSLADFNPEEFGLPPIPR